MDPQVVAQMVVAGIGVVERVSPVFDKVLAEIGPTFEAEIKDGKAIWADVDKAWLDFKAALDAAKSSVPLG